MSLLLVLGMLPLRAHIDLYFGDQQSGRIEVVYRKGAKNEANVISYFLMTSE